LGLHTPSAFPIAEAFETSPMGASKFWTDNGDGTFTGQNIDFNQTNSAYSYLDLYFMGLLPPDEVPDFFLIQNLSFIGPEGSSIDKTIYAGDRLAITIEDVIAANGPRVPGFEDSQKEFTLGLIGIVMPGAVPSAMLLERIAGIRGGFVDYWSRATGGVSRIVGLKTPFTDEPLVAGATPLRGIHVLELRARIDALLASPFPWTDNPIIAGTTTVRWTHILELRTAVDQAYADGMAVHPPYTPGDVGTPIRAAHITELRDFVVALEGM
jgi:hypothetical protein